LRARPPRESVPILSPPPVMFTPPAKVEVAVVEVAVITPAVRLPIDEEAVVSPPFRRSKVLVAEAGLPPQVVGVKGQAKSEEAAA